MLSLRKRQTETIVPVDTCELMPNPMQPRRQFDDPALRELAASIRTHGVLQPVIVRPADPMPYPDNIRGASFEIIAGERRWRAAQLAGLEKIPCVIREADRGESAELALVENLQREGLSPFEEAEAIRNLLLMTSMTQIELASKLSLSPSALSNKLRLLKLSESERRLIAEFGMGERHARAFLKLSDPAQRREAILRAGKDGLSASETEKLVEWFGAEPAPPVPLPDPVRKEPQADAHPQRIAVIRDMRFFFNTIDRATALLREAGFSAKDNREETDEGYEIRIFVPKVKEK